MESAIHWTGFVGSRWAQLSIRRASVVVLRCCFQHEMTLHVSLICCEQNASKLLFRFSFRPFYTQQMFFEEFFFVNYSVTIIQFQERVTRLSAWLSQFSFRNFWTFSITKMFQFLLFFSVLSATWIHAAFVHFLTVFFWFFRFLLIFPKILVLSLFQKRLSNLWHNLKNDRKNRIAVLFYSTSWIVLSKLRSRMCLNTARSQVYFSLSFPRSVRRVVCYNDNIFSRRTLIKL